jgi:hypothetical protein
MRSPALGLLLALAGCAGTMPPAGAKVCDAAKVQRFLGRQHDPALVARIAALANAATSRVVRPGERVTMDYRSDRLNVSLAGDGRIGKLTCG